jgi:hypothetical protein
MAISVAATFIFFIPSRHSNALRIDIVTIYDAPGGTVCAVRIGVTQLQVSTIDRLQYVLHDRMPSLTARY